MKREQATGGIVAPDRRAFPQPGNTEAFANALLSGHMPPKDAVRIGEMVNHFPYDDPAPDAGHPTVSLFETPRNPGTHLLHVALQGAQITERPPLNLVFLIDTSGSIRDRDKPPLLRQSFRLTLSETRKVPVDQLGMALFPIASGVKVQIEFNPAVVAEYRLIGHETRALRREDFNNDMVDAGDIGAGRQVTALHEVAPVGSDAGPTDPLRYGATPSGPAGELGFPKLRAEALSRAV